MIDIFRGVRALGGCRRDHAWAYMTIGERPPVQSGRRINRIWGDEAGQVPERR
ncbi:MAG: hypothetical protein R3E94_04330 [Burkholderiaceae bacterium]